MKIISRIKKLWYTFTCNSYKIQQIRNEEFVKAGGKLGNNFHGNGTFPHAEPYLIEIGDDVTIASGTHWVTHDNSVIKLGINATDYFGKIKIGNNCFIGTNVTLLPGVMLGDNTIVGASSVVTKSFPNGNVVIAGNPAKIICTVDEFKEKKKNICINIDELGRDKKKEILYSLPEEKFEHK
ncbi:DapH/DapD/GlmU-related protein [uncultured Eubacterium sp.]|uniref:acyltransferase n=1 Tax=uncultured Eubacterium sp. TaxID=165185 RepID=UPI00262C7C48|nr:acyltransferase [uncultured Eubacterium sp.]